MLRIWVAAYLIVYCCSVILDTFVCLILCWHWFASITGDRKLYQISVVILFPALIQVWFCVFLCILKLKQSELDLINVLLWLYNSVWLRIYCVLISVSITNWFIRALNQFISLQYSISLLPRFIKVFQIAKTIFQRSKLVKIFQSSIHSTLELSLKRFHFRLDFFFLF